MSKWSENYFEDDGTELISEALKINSTLTSLDLGCDHWILYICMFLFYAEIAFQITKLETKEHNLLEKH